MTAMNLSRSTSVVVLGLGLAACGVANSDPSLWNKSKDLGATQYPLPNPGAAGATGAAGGGTPPAGNGGEQQGTGNAPPMGNGGVVQQGSGGTTGLPPGAGGVMTTGSGGIFGGSGGFVTTGSGGTTLIGMGGTTMTGSGGTTSTGNSGKCMFSFDVTTVTARGVYAPRNVGAIWITDSNNKFVKSLKVWGSIRLGNATVWVQSSNNNKTDAVTSATRSSHGALNATWNCTDVSEQAVPDGQYNAMVTFTENDANPFFGGTSPNTSVKFTKGAMGADVMGTDTANFTGMHVKLMPQ